MRKIAAFAFLLLFLPVWVVAQIPPVGSLTVGTTSVTNGTNGDCLTISGGKLGQTASCGAAAGLTVGTSTITGGSTGRIVYDNAGVVGEMTTTGTGTVAALQAGPTFTGTLTSSGVLSSTSVAETYTAPSITANVLTIDLSAGTVFNVASNANITTFTISNAVAGKANSFTLFLTGNGSAFTQSWGSVKWPGAIAPILTTTNGKVDALTFVSNDGGTTWFGFIGGQSL